MSAAADLLVDRLGWRALLVHGDPFVLIRWMWLRSRARLAAGSAATGRPPRVLDAGCGNGAFALWAAASGCDVLAVSDAPEDLAKARRRAAKLGIGSVRFEQYDLRELDSTGEALGEFDAIFCLEVIEHVLDDVGLLRRLAARLRPGGLIYLSTPTHDHRPLLGEEAHLSGVEDGRHVRWGYSASQLGRVLVEAGLEPVEYARFGGYLTQRVCGLLWRLERLSAPLAWAVTLPLRGLTLVDNAITARLGTAYMSLGAVARKPG
jgi:SAM-dependent methyltransferase